MLNNVRAKLSPKRLIVYLFIFFVMVVAGIFINTPEKNQLEFSLTDSNISTMQVYYLSNTDADDAFSEQKSTAVDMTQKEELVAYTASNIKAVRLDFGSEIDKTGVVEDLRLYSGFVNGVFTADEIKSQIDLGSIKTQDIEVELVDNKLQIRTIGEDPYMVIPTELFALTDFEINYIGIAVSFVIATILIYIIFRYVSLKDNIILLKNIFWSKKTLLKLALNDFKSRYTGSAFGSIWAFIQPVSTILIFWFVFEIGLRSTGVENVPFILWLMSGLIPWFFFSESWNGVTNVYAEYSYLVKKVVFKIDILPIVKIISALIVHVFFIAFMLLVFAIYGFYPNFNMLGIIYYMGCMVFLVIGLGFITASVAPFFKDLMPIMGIILQMGMWATPIMWNVSMIGADLMWIFKLNPMYYIVTGYRNSMLGDVVTPVTLQDTAYFWFVSIIILFLGMTLFRKLKTHFADVL